MDQYILLVGCFDTKGEVFAYLRKAILAQGERVLTINTGIMGTTPDFPVDYEASLVAQKANHPLTELQKNRDRGHAIEVMSRGAAVLVRELAEAGKVKAVMGMGGGGGTFIALAAMQSVPFGIPKLCLSTVAAKDLSRQAGSKDITLMPSIVDVAGLNSIIAPLIDQAAAAVCAMANVKATATHKPAGRIAISMFGNTTACVDQCTALLQEQGYEVFAFHANGVGGKTMEALIAEGCFDAVLDVTTTELADDLCGGICSAGPDRLMAAAKQGIPQVVVPGCLDMVNFGHPDAVPDQYKNRMLYSWAPDVTLMRTDEAENNELGKRLARKLNPSTGPVRVVLPLNGISQMDAAGGLFHQPSCNTALFDAIKDHASERVPVIESAAHINDPAFASLLVGSLVAMLQQTNSTIPNKS
ncbi:Tm-1-like ATP-binding domain-containing protein [Nibrella saemangeumensis]|uniref:Tm-1-like ATP-binding domain-containing protein n=1 Tax=Nibrella saemangeumensis TaxID=1084526 RepID=A0ABP8NM84_9BACT